MRDTQRYETRDRNNEQTAAHLAAEGGVDLPADKHASDLLSTTEDTNAKCVSRSQSVRTIGCQASLTLPLGTVEHRA